MNPLAQTRLGECLLRLEMMKKRPFGQAGCRADFVDGRRHVAGASHQVDANANQRVACVLSGVFGHNSEDTNQLVCCQVAGDSGTSCGVSIRQLGFTFSRTSPRLRFPQISRRIRRPRARCRPKLGRARHPCRTGTVREVDQGRVEVSGPRGRDWPSSPCERRHLALTQEADRFPLSMEGNRCRVGELFR